MLDKAVDFFCSRLGFIPCVTFEHVDAGFRYHRKTLHVLAAPTFDQCLVIPLIEVRLVDNFSSTFIGVDFVAEREDDDNVGRLARR